MIANTYWPEMEILGPHLVSASKIGLTITLIGAGLNRNVLKSVDLNRLHKAFVF
jgi:hypothetical protein